MGSLFDLDLSYRSDYGTFAGVDEAGRGPLAGPLVASAVILPDHFNNDALNDSKKLSDKKRRILLEVIKENALHISTGTVTASGIDRNRMSWAVRTVFKRAMKPLLQAADFFLIDGNSVSGLEAPARFLVKGDSRSLSIAAASIVAKVTRDDIMLKEHESYPQYSFHSNKGYGTAAHIRAIESHGPSPSHRMSFEPLKSMFPTGQLDLFSGKPNLPGRAAENSASRFLQRQGYRILEENWRCSAGEIDLIVEREGSVKFVEVKSSFSGLEETALRRIDIGKRKRIREAAVIWLAESGFSGTVSFLAVIVTPGGIETIPFN